ncbi:helix-turn-helix transcriptional regulator [Geothrix sp.]|uniref:helix-turn-helix transcriptional regulator n=1 Tax=Geothrix sp. TaxID=1962974 RepID=UPI0025C3413B|nr:helix-turn-helix transcriptional regulator [Geothrix sp.]
MPTKRSHSTARLLFASNLRRARLQCRLSQEGLAELSELHRTYVGSVERGERNVSIDNMERLAKAVGWELRDLLSPMDGE